MVSVKPDYTPLKRNKAEEEEQSRALRTKWTDYDRIKKEMRHVAAERVSKSAVDGYRYVTPTIIRLPQHVKSVRPDLFMYTSVDMPLGLYNRGDLRVSTEPERRRIDAVLAFLQKINEGQHDEQQLDWEELCMRVVPDPSQIKLLYEDAPDLTEHEVRHLLTIDAVYLLCLFQGLVLFQGHRFSDIPALSRKEIYILSNKGTLQDILLLENQIPLVLVQNVLGLALELTGKGVGGTTFTPLEEVDKTGFPAATFTSGGGVSLESADSERALRLEMGKLLKKVIPSFLGVCGLPSFGDHTVSALQLASSDHLLDCVYKVVCSRSAGLRIIDRQLSHDRDGLMRESTSIQVDDESKGSNPGCNQFWTCLRKLNCAGGSNLDPITKEVEGPFVNRARVIPSASQLKKVGIKVKGSSVGTIFDYYVVQGVFKDTLHIPKIELWKYTLEMFRNLALLEVRPGKLYEDQPVIEYLTLMNQLVHTEEDVEILCKSNTDCAILNTLGDVAAVVDLCNNINQGTSSQQRSPQFQKLCSDIRLQYSNRKKRAFGEFVETYLNKPWKIAALLAIVLLLVLTLVQALYAS